MDILTPQRQEIIQAIENLPNDTLWELATFIEYLYYKKQPSTASVNTPKNTNSSSRFLMNIAGLSETSEDNIAECDEEILANEIDPIRGWGLKPNNEP